ncbi:hypothetical protein M3226_02700 [Neobacillus cucumis]|uniref:hypothetical protein n=1 Tax=Neobacillus cucumis TaxID=1740721 RepID=UPI0020416A78|nr:hypothetical protein [Neobacillus cucumis]MCM3724611.1 hypothetical protein [Neobacillus cucumis]
MKFETKYLIRWGIPGWVFLLTVGIFLIVSKDIDAFKLINKDPVKSLSAIITLASIGVPVGYLFHQLYFGYSWVASKRKGIYKITGNITGYIRKFPNDDEKEYLYLEYLWQSELSLMNQNKRDYLAERYRHLLSTTHSLGVLFFSVLTSFIISLFIIKSISLGALDIVLVVSIEVVILGFIWLNYYYYSSTAMNFLGLFLNEFINQPERNQQRITND